jgi:hypothetical protein
MITLIKNILRAAFTVGTIGAQVEDRFAPEGTVAT